MKKVKALFAIVLLPSLVLVKSNGSDYHSWPMSMTEGWMKNEGCIIGFRKEGKRSVYPSVSLHFL